jgi:hypothetical protein
MAVVVAVAVREQPIAPGVNLLMAVPAAQVAAPRLVLTEQPPLAAVAVATTILTAAMVVPVASS